MAKTFAEYAREREASMTPAQRDLMRAFDRAAAVGSVIFGARKARGLRQSDLAELSGVTQADISRIERGQVAPTTQTLLKLTDALGVEILFVLAEPGTAPAEPACAVDREVVIRTGAEAMAYTANGGGRRGDEERCSESAPARTR